MHQIKLCVAFHKFLHINTSFNQFSHCQHNKSSHVVKCLKCRKLGWLHICDYLNNLRSGKIKYSSLHYMHLYAYRKMYILGRYYTAHIIWIYNTEWASACWLSSLNNLKLLWFPIFLWYDYLSERSEPNRIIPRGILMRLTVWSDQSVRLLHLTFHSSSLKIQESFLLTYFFSKKDKFDEYFYWISHVANRNEKGFEGKTPVKFTTAVKNSYISAKQSCR